MKTQISHLVNGSINTVGSSFEQRSETFSKILYENPESMKITLMGFDLVLNHKTSTTGKTHSWSSIITIELYKELFGSFGIPTKAESVQSIVISQDLKIYVYSGSKKGFYNQINESEITIN